MSAVLAERQRWFYRAITTARSPSPAPILGGTAVPPHIGLAVYRHAYRARLHEALSDDFSAVARVLGEPGFARVVDRFIRAHPPQDATLNAYGRFFAPWLARARIARRAPLAELARLEWALVESLHAPLASGLSGEALAAIAPHAWGSIRLRPAPSLRVLAGQFNVDTVFDAVQREQTPPPFRRQRGGVAILRRADGLRRIPLDALEARVLTALVDDAPLAEALARVPAHRLPAIRDSFTRWVAQGFFTALA
jgi:hypothetical protein